MKRKTGEYHERSMRANYGAELKGFGHSQLQKQRGLRGTTLGPASSGRRLSAAERAAIEDQMRRDGKL